MTRRAMQFIEEDDGEKPWCLHLSYIKPHWPYIAPAPYNDMYSAADVQPVHSSESERENTNPTRAALPRADLRANFLQGRGPRDCDTCVYGADQTNR